MKQLGAFPLVLLDLAAPRFNQPVHESRLIAMLAIVNKVVFERSQWPGVTPAPQKGFLYVMLPPHSPGIWGPVRSEGKHLSELAGTRQVIGLGGVEGFPRLRSAGENPVMPDLYPVNIGIRKLRPSESPPVKALLELH